MEEAIQEYQMTVHLFGAVSSLSCFNFSLEQTAKDISKKVTCVWNHPPKLWTIVFVRSRMNKLPLNWSKVSAKCMRGGFNLTEFIRNSRADPECIPREKHSKELRDLDLD